jgi:Protein of unknown function (DUF3352)
VRRLSSGREAVRALRRRLRGRGGLGSARVAEQPTPLMGSPSGGHSPIAAPQPPVEARAALPRSHAAAHGNGAVGDRERRRLRLPGVHFPHPHLPRRPPGWLPPRPRPAPLRETVARGVSGVGELWSGIDIYVRRRLAIVAVAIAVVLAFVLLAVPALPCQYPGGDVCPPPDDAAELVPGDALAYVHLDADPSTAQYRLAADDIAPIPTLSGQLIDRLLAGLPAIGGSATRFDDAIRPWLGDEAALALLPARGAPQEVELLEVAGVDAARRYQRSFEGAGARTVTYREIDINVGRGRVASAIVRGFLAIGTAPGIRAVIDTATGAPDAVALADSPAAAVRGALPAERVADAYLSPAGTRALAGRPTGLLSTLAPFFAPGATKGVAIGLVAADGSLELRIRSALDPSRARARPGFFAAFAPFEQTLAGALPADTLAYLGIGQPGRAISALVRQASAEEPGLARAISALLGRVQAGGRPAVRQDLLPALGSEGALALEPGPAAPARQRRPGAAKSSRSAPLPGLGGAANPRAASAGAPSILYLGAGIDPKAARPALARLQTPIARALAPGTTPAGFTTRRIAGVTAQSLVSSAGLGLTYAIVGHRLVVASNPAGVASVVRGEGGLAGTSAYQQATPGFPSSSSVIVYLDLHELVALGERAGLARSPAYAAVAGEIRRLDALAVSVTSTPDSLATEARLTLAPG